MNITELITENTILLDLEVKDKQELLEHLIDLISKSSIVSNKDDVAKEIFTRESIMSTGIGKGIALPHAKTNAVSSGIGAFAVLKKPIEFDSLDGKPVDVVFMLLGKENDISGHLRVLSKISRIMNDNSFRENISNIKNPKEVISYFQSKLDKF